jgi:hypothetical protein
MLFTVIGRLLRSSGANPFRPVRNPKKHPVNWMNFAFLAPNQRPHGPYIKEVSRQKNDVEVALEHIPEEIAGQPATSNAEFRQISVPRHCGPPCFCITWELGESASEEIQIEL